MPTPTTNTRQPRHTGMLFPGPDGKTWLSFRIINRTNNTVITPGMAVGLSRNEVVSNALEVFPLKATDGASGTYEDARCRTFGVSKDRIVPSGDSAGGETDPEVFGEVVWWGYVTNMLVTGSVSVGDWLMASDTWMGVCVAQTAAADKKHGFAFAIADQTHSGNIGQINAFVGPRY